MGNTLTNHAWAHLGRVKIVAEIPEEDVLFWAASQFDRENVFHWLAATRAKILLTRGFRRPRLAWDGRKLAIQIITSSGFCLQNNPVTLGFG
jgi:hypothetical protein